MSYYERLQGYLAEHPHVANEAADEEGYPVQPPLSALEIAKAEQAALVVSAGMKQEFIDGPPVLDLTSRGW
jgi:hypothetical protein